jgi:hypothetical protein
MSLNSAGLGMVLVIDGLMRGHYQYKMMRLKILVVTNGVAKTTKTYPICIYDVV